MHPTSNLVLCLLTTSIVSKFQVHPPIEADDSNHEELNRLERNIQLYPTKAVVISTHNVGLEMLNRRLTRLNDEYEDLKTTVPQGTSPHFQRMDRTRERTENLLQAACVSGTEKRFVVSIPLLLFSGFFSLIGGAIAGFGVSYAIGGGADRRITEESLAVKEELTERHKELEENFAKNIRAHEQRIERLEKKWNTAERSITLENDYEHLFSYTNLVTDLDNYQYENSPYLEGMQQRIKNNSEAREEMGEVRYGTFGADALLSLSESEIFYHSKDGTANCESVTLISKLKTMIPLPDLVGTATDEKNKYKIDENRTLFVNPHYITEESPRRRGKKYTKLRAVVGNNQMIKNVKVFNNTLLFIENFSNFTVTKTCGSESLDFQVFQNPIIVIPPQCSITSQWLNISSHKVILTDFIITTEAELHTIDSENFKPFYFQTETDLETDSDIEKAIEDIFVLENRLTSLEKEQLENQRLREKILNATTSFVDSTLGSFGKWVKETFANPILATLSFFVVIFIIGFLVFISVKCGLCKSQNNNPNPSPIIMMQPPNPV